jgi:toxin ParE1/3/4
MALRIVWAQSALDDLDDILFFIAADKPLAAAKLHRRSLTAIRKLRTHPMLGRKVPELSPSPYRELVVAPVRILYRVDEKVIHIVHVVRQERDVTAM